MAATAWVVVASGLYLLTYVTAYVNLGCYSDAEVNGLVRNTTGDTANNGISDITILDVCPGVCRGANKAVFGIRRNGRTAGLAQCFCGDELPTDIVSASSCSYKCPRGTDSPCGGPDSVISVYSANFGCYSDTAVNGLERNMAGDTAAGGISDKTILDVCPGVCRGANKAVFGMRRNGKLAGFAQCFCGDELPTDIVSASSCSYKCPRDTVSPCGGPDSVISVYSDVTAGSEHVGCFSLTGTDGGTYPQNEAIIKCRTACKTAQVTYYGLQKQTNGTVNCHCLDGINDFKGRLTSCDQTCAGSSCGGTSVVDYYTVCPVGYYGETECDTACDCTLYSWVCKFGRSTEQCIWCEANSQGNRFCAVDECQDIPCGGGSCTNSFGSYTCSCYAGYQLNTGPTCTDINECLRTTYPCGSNELCTNTGGNYTCQACPAGRQLSQDRTRCDDVDECSDSTDDCEQVCENTDGGFRCACNDGYEAERNFCKEKHVESRSQNIVPIVVPVVVVILLILVAVPLAVYFVRRANGKEHTKVPKPTSSTDPTHNQQEHADDVHTYVNQGVEVENQRIEVEDEQAAAQYEEIPDLPMKKIPNIPTERSYQQLDGTQIVETPAPTYESI